MSETPLSDNDIFRLFQKGDLDAVISLIETGRLQPNGKLLVKFISYDHEVPLLPYFVEAGATEIVRMLVARGANVNQRYERRIPLHGAVRQENRELIETLLSAGADVEAGGETALMLAAENLDIWAVERLLKAGADATKVTSKQGRTAIWYATSTDYKSKTSERIQIIRILSSAGCKPNGNELHWPVFHKDIALVKLLLELGCTVNVPLSHGVRRCGPQKGDTPLSVAVEWSGLLNLGTEGERSEISKPLADLAVLLLHSGADPNIPNGRGETPLWRTVFAKDLEIAKILVDAGGDPNLRPPNGRTGSALDFARQLNLPDFVELFEKRRR